MVVTGLLLLFGGRADPARVRTGCTQASVDGRLVVGAHDAVVGRVRDAGGDVDAGAGEAVELDLRRVVSAAGRSRAFVGGAPAPVAVLAELAQHLVAGPRPARPNPPPPPPGQRGGPHPLGRPRPRRSSGG